MLHLHLCYLQLHIFYSAEKTLHLLLGSILLVVFICFYGYLAVEVNKKINKEPNERVIISLFASGSGLVIIMCLILIQEILYG